MNALRGKRIIVGSLLGFLGLGVLAAAGFGVGYLLYGWHRLDTLPTPAAGGDLEFRPYAEHRHVPGGDGRPYIVRIDPAAGRGAVLFFGSGHTQDPDDPQIAMIREAWHEFAPTVGLCESRLGLYIGGLRRGVTMFGEVGTPYALARRSDVAVYSLEPGWEDEIAAMLRRFDRREVAAFYTLRAFVGERAGRSGAALDDLAGHLLEKRGSLPGLEGSFASLAEFDAWWDATLRDGIGDWRTMPGHAMWPGVENETLLTRLADASNRIRDEHMTRVLIDLARRGERVFVVCGASHALTIEPALRSALELQGSG